MPDLTVSSFPVFASLLVACRGPAGVAEADRRAVLLADVAGGARSLDAALGTEGLAAVAQEMARAAEEHARYFTHPGPARDDALALFWQVAPAAFADPAVFAEADPVTTAERMVTAVRASPHGRDFAATVLAEPLFRAVALASLRVLQGRDPDLGLRLGDG